jgi:hypothetical protein
LQFGAVSFDAAPNGAVLLERLKLNPFIIKQLNLKQFKNSSNSRRLRKTAPIGAVLVNAVPNGAVLFKWLYVEMFWLKRLQFEPFV